MWSSTTLLRAMRTDPPSLFGNSLTCRRSASVCCTEVQGTDRSVPSNILSTLQLATWLRLTSVSNELGCLISVQGAGQQGVLHVGAGGTVLQLLRLREHAQLQPPRCAQICAGRATVLGGGDACGRLQIRSGLHHDPRPLPLAPQPAWR